MKLHELKNTELVYRSSWLLIYETSERRLAIRKEFVAKGDLDASD